MVVVGRLPQRWPGAVVIEWGAKLRGAMAAIGHLDLRRRLRGSRRTHTQRARAVFALVESAGVCKAGLI